MPIVDTRQFAGLSKKKRRRLNISSVLLIIVLLGGVLAFMNMREVYYPQPGSEQSSAAAEAESAEDSKSTNSTSLKQFSPAEFNALALAVKYPNTQLFPELPLITGDKTADERIRTIAERRGYVLTSIPVGSIQKINEPRLVGDDLLQPLAAQSWQELKAAAGRDGVPISITSAYRSPEYQRNLFMGRLTARGVTVAQISAGRADMAVEAVLSQAAVPGYSRHHTGYTIDLWCEDGSGSFLASSCFRWIGDDNYRVAKENGWIPSYPEGVEDQGPEPEPWEYVWVGEELVTE